MFNKSVLDGIESKRVGTALLFNALRRDFPRSIPKNFPMISLNGVDTHIIVYKNLLFDSKRIKRSVPIIKEVFRPTITLLRKKPNFVTEVQYLNSKKSIKMTQFLLEYLQLGNLKTDELRDYSQLIMSKLYKKSINMVFCETPEDHIKLYEIHAFSCMTPKSTYPEYNTWLKTKLYKDYRLWPTSWYSYNPHTQGVYLTVNGRGVARVILLRQDTKKEFKHYYYSIYAETNTYRELLRNKLENLGMRSVTSIKIITPFIVPAITKFSIPICPLPFHDCIRGPLYCRFDSKKNEFHFSPKNTKKASLLGGSYEYRGYITSTLSRADRVISRNEGN